MIRDLFDNSIVAYKTATTQTVNLVLDTIRLAMQKEKIVAAELQLHSDQGSRPDVKFCVSVFRQSQEWRWKTGRILAWIP